VDFLTGANLLQVVLTIPTILIALRVVYEWTPRAIKYLHDLMMGVKWDAAAWFIVGVWTSHFAMTSDNGYWHTAWSAHITNHPATDWLMSFGPVANIPSRQLLGMFSAYCHLRSVAIQKELPLTGIHIYCVWSILLGVLYGAYLWIFEL